MMNLTNLLSCRVNLAICILGAIFSFMPLMQGIVDGEENQLFLDELMESQYYRDASLSTLLITIPSGIDAFVDIVLDSIEYFTNYARQNIVSSSVKHLSSKSSALRLSPAERLGFVIGIASLSVFILATPTEGYSYDSVALYYSLTNFSTILSICPIVFFLERCTKLWTPLRAFLVILFINIGSVFGSASYCFAIDSDEYYILSMTASASIACATFVLAIVCGLCVRDFLLYLNRSRKTAFDKESWTSYIHKTFSQSRGSSDFYKHYVPEIHTFALIAICVTNVAWYFIIDDVVQITSTFMCIQSGVAVIVFVVEIRIRQNEVLRGLDLLDSKRSFVRYISHEIRTPLSTVMMGLDLLVSDLDNAALGCHPKGMRRGDSALDPQGKQTDTVLLIQESCRLAVEICDDLLNYETFEDDDLPLVVKTLPAALLFHEIVQPFNVQARRNGVMLHCDILDPQDAFDLEQYKQDACLDDITAHANLMQFYTVPSSPTPSGRHSRNGGVGSILRALVDVDRRRIAHVLRNLVSNALTFTPSGGEVSVTIRLSRRMGPKSTPTYLGKNSIHRTSSRGSGSIFGSLSTPNEDPATIENTLSNSERIADGPSDLLSFDNCVTQTGFMHKPEESPLPAPGRPVCFSRDSRSESNAFHGDCTVRSAKLDCVMSALSEEDSSASHTPGNRRSTGGTGTGTPHNTTRFEEDGGFFRTGWLRRKARSEKSKQPARQKKKNPSYVIIEVTDTGSGIAKENLDRVFKEIVQFNPNELHGGGHGGSGLGMVLSKGIVEAHGGKLWLTSEGLGKGCTFGFGLPISRVQTLPDHRSKADTAMQSKGSVHGSCSGGESGPRLGNTIDVHARNFHSSVVAALSGLDSLPRPYGPICSLMSPARKCLRPPAFKPETSIGKIASFREPLFNEGDQKRNQYEIYPQETALNMSTLSTTPDESRVAREETDLSAGSSTSRSLTPRDHTSEVFSRSISLITADFIPEVQVIASPSRIYNRDGPIHRRSQSADAMKPVQRPRSLSTVSPKHALIVEDSAVCRRMLGKVLQSLSITYEEAEDGVQAIEKVQLSLLPEQKDQPNVRRFDLILCDNIMPNMCGPAAVRSIRGMGYIGPIFGVTGNMLPQDVDDFIAHGADMILGKPLKISILSEAVKVHFSEAIKLTENDSPGRQRKTANSDVIQASRTTSDVNCGNSRRNSDVIEATRRHSDASRINNDVIGSLSRRNSDVINQKSRRDSGIIDTTTGTATATATCTGTATVSRRNSDIMESSRRSSSTSDGKSCSDSDESMMKLPSIKI